jgi:two-component system alkaline phosphatase synthesis response regulator PhoP
MAWKILIVDDEPDIVEFIQYNLDKLEYRTASAHNGAEAIKIAKIFQPDMIILDVMMPEMDGIQTCINLRMIPELSSTFIMFLTARNEEFSEIAGFEAGADDYIYKPIKPRALMSRIHAILQRRNSLMDSENKILRLKDLIVDPISFTVKLKDKELVLPKKEFELLYLLASKPGKVFTRDAILSRVWGENVYVVDRTIDVHIRKIREKIGDEMIQTVKGVGYKFAK